MSYLRKFEYEISPEESYPIIRNCSVCKGKSTFINTNNFRVNANGNRIDVWLIYQCEKCKHTYNLTIYERHSAGTLSSDEYQNFMENNKMLAKIYGTDKSLFVRNRAEIDWSGIRYQVTKLDTMELVSEVQTIYRPGDLIQVGNPYGIKIRTEKLVADLLQITRNKVKLLKEKGIIEFMKDPSVANISFILRGDIFGD